MSEMVDRVARAICVGDSQFTACCGSCGTIVEQAKRAIVAMREPTQDMVLAGATTPLMEQVNNCLVVAEAHRAVLPHAEWSSGPLAEAWRAMLDEALK